MLKKIALFVFLSCMNRWILLKTTEFENCGDIPAVLVAILWNGRLSTNNSTQLVSNTCENSKLVFFDGWNGKWKKFTGLFLKNIPAHSAVYCTPTNPQTIKKKRVLQKCTTTSTEKGGQWQPSSLSIQIHWWGILFWSSALSFLFFSLHFFNTRHFSNHQSNCLVSLLRSGQTALMSIAFVFFVLPKVNLDLIGNSSWKSIHHINKIEVQKRISVIFLINSFQVRSLNYTVVHTCSAALYVNFTLLTHKARSSSRIYSIEINDSRPLTVCVKTRKNRVTINQNNKKKQVFAQHARSGVALQANTTMRKLVTLHLNHTNQTSLTLLETENETVNPKLQEANNTNSTQGSARARQDPTATPTKKTSSDNQTTTKTAGSQRFVKPSEVLRPPRSHVHLPCSRLNECFVAASSQISISEPVFCEILFNW